MARRLIKQGRLDEALGKLEEALLMHCCSHEEKSQATAGALYLLGHIYSQQGKLDEALNVHNKALRYRRRALGDGHRAVAISINDIACVHMKKKTFTRHSSC